MGEGRHNSSYPSPFIWEKGLGDEGYQGFCTFGMLPNVQKLAELGVEWN
jgi:hypothetical protein